MKREKCPYFHYWSTGKGTILSCDKPECTCSPERRDEMIEQALKGEYSPSDRLPAFMLEALNEGWRPWE